MACSSSASRPWSELSKHLNSAPPSSFSQQAFAPSSTSTSSFRTATTSSSGKGKHRASLESDWTAFSSPITTSSSSTTASMPISIPRTSMPPKPSDDTPASPYWNPETETLAVLSSSWSSVTSTSTYDVPSADEAFSISSSPATSCSGSFYRFANGSTSDVVKEAQTPPHPLTYEAAPHAAWDFDKLFSKKRRWFGGARLPYSSHDEDVGEDADMDSSTDTEPSQPSRSDNPRTSGSPTRSCAKVLLERQAAHDREHHHPRRAPSSSRSRDRASCVPVQHSKLCTEIPKAVLEEQAERQQIAFDALRATAQSRLKLVGGHLLDRPVPASTKPTLE